MEHQSERQVASHNNILVELVLLKIFMGRFSKYASCSI